MELHHQAKKNVDLILGRLLRSKLEELLGSSPRTGRWRWWLETFARSRFWATSRAHFRTPVDEKSLPLALVRAFDGAG